MPHELVKRINTIVSGVIFQRLSNEMKQKWINVLEDRAEDTNFKEENKMVDWTELERWINRISSGDLRAFTSLQEAVDIGFFLERYIAMGSSELI
jgi:hypothetical protein